MTAASSKGVSRPWRLSEKGLRPSSGSPSKGSVPFSDSPELAGKHGGKPQPDFLKGIADVVNPRNPRATEPGIMSSFGNFYAEGPRRHQIRGAFGTSASKASHKKGSRGPISLGGAEVMENAPK